MGKTFEALEKAEKIFQKNMQQKAAVGAEEKYLLNTPVKDTTLISPNGWHQLQYQLSSRYPNQPLRRIMFTGITRGIGVTNSAIQFAKALMKASGRRVLLIDANLRTPRLHQIFNLNPYNGFSDLLAQNGTKVFQFKKPGKGDLYVFPCGRNYADGVCDFESSRLDALFKSARQKFDYVILDCAPISRSSESQALCAKVDGVLLVIEAGKTRRQVAQRAKKEIEEAGGKLLGVVLNKRRYYIPDWIYRRL